MRLLLVALAALALLPTTTQAKDYTIRLVGRSSWYGGPDPQDNDRPALAGATNRVPGIAVYNRRTLGGYWRVKVKDKHGKTVVRVERQTDIGPAPWTGKKVDLNYAFIRQLGFRGNDYHNGRVVAEYLGKKKVEQGRRVRKPAPKVPPAALAPSAAPSPDVQMAQRSYLSQRGNPQALMSLLMASRKQ